MYHYNVLAKYTNGNVNESTIFTCESHIVYACVYM